MDFSNLSFSPYSYSPSYPIGQGSATPVSQKAADSSTVTGLKTGKAEKPEECQTCKNRKYVDASDEGNVSFKAPGHIDPNVSASVVLSHEGEHVQNAVRKGNEQGNELVSASVSLKTAICPECGRAYIAGGTTRTRIKYGNSDYDKNKRNADKNALLGANIDLKG